MVFKDTFSRILPVYDKQTQYSKFVLTQVAGSFLDGGAVSAVFTYPLKYAHTALAADIGVVPKYTGVIDCIMKTVEQNGVASLYNGVGCEFANIFIYRGV